MPQDNQVAVTSELRTHPNLRKLARALILLARRQLDEQAALEAEAVSEHTGDAA
jgi:hypothetical protein